MEIYYSTKFQREYKKIPIRIKKIAEKKEVIFRGNPFDKRLKTHKLKGRLDYLWSFSLDNNYRIIFEFIKKDKIWFHSVGNHDIYRFVE